MQVADNSCPASRNNSSLGAVTGALVLALLLGNPGYISADSAGLSPTASPGPPSIAVYQPDGVQSGNVTISFVIDDVELDLVGILAEYSTDGGTTWLAASVSSDTTNLDTSLYSGTITWYSGTDLGGQVLDDVLFRLTPSDWEGDGTPDIVRIDIDNNAPSSISASGGSGYSTFRFWFNEAVSESSATNIGNYSLTGGLTVDTIAVVDEWAQDVTTVPVFKYDAAFGELDGKIYVVGGQLSNTSGFSNSVEIYDPSTGGWAAAASMTTARRNAVVAGINGRLYVSGGYNGSNVNLTEIYDAATNTWTTSTAPTDPITATSYYFTGAVINGKWYVNQDNGQIHIYDPHSDTWTSVSGGLPQRGIDAAAINGKLYLAGGYYRSPALVAYDPASGLTTTLTSMTIGRYKAFGGNIDGKFYVVGGNSATDSGLSVEIYDPATDTWRTGQNIPFSFQEDEGVIADGKVYIPRNVSPSGFTQMALSTFSWDELDITMTSGDRLPPPPNTVTLTANNITDRAGNTRTTLQTTFTPSSGQAPRIGLYHGYGPLTGDITVHHVVADNESNPVWLLAEYQLPGQATWNAATVTGDTTDIQSANYEADLVWKTGTDISNAAYDNVKFRVKVRDNSTSWGSSDTAIIDVDNKSPESITAEGISGDFKVRFWFNERVLESTATDTLNISLTGGTQTIAGLTTEELWTADALTVPTPKYDVGTGELDGKFYVVGGYYGGYLNTVQVYDPTTDTWSSTANMINARSRPIVAGIDGKLYVIAGYNGGYRNWCEVYDPETDTWTAIASAPEATDRYYTYGDVINGKLYLNDDNAKMYIYDPNFDTWETRNVGHNRGGFAAAAIGGKLYLAGGYSGGYQNNLNVYDPVTNNLTPLAAMPTARNDLIGGAIDGKFYVVGGYNNITGQLATVEVYDPGTNTWTSLPDAPHASDKQIGAIAGGKLYFGTEVSNISYFDLFSRNTYAANLGAGQGLPAPPTSLTLTASNISDLVGNITSAPINISFTALTGNAPDIALYQPSGTQTGDITIHHVISDDESNPIWLKVEYSTDDGTTWLTATVTGSLDSIRTGGYEADLIWKSGTDVPTQELWGVLFKVSARDGETWNAEDTVLIDVDNLAPQQLSAEGLSGDSSIWFWFNESVSESTATNTSNFSLTGGLTAGDIQVSDEWTTDVLTAPSYRYDVGYGELGGELYIVGGYKQSIGDEVGTVEVYDPDSDIWWTAADLPTPRSNPLVAGINGNLYVIGGYNNGDRNDVEVYDPDTDTWEARNAAPFSGSTPYRFDGEPINGKLYINHLTGIIYIYDPPTDTWESVSGGQAYYHVRTAVADGKLYMVGGESGGAKNDLVVFDPATRNVTALAPLPTPRWTGAIGVIDGKIYYAAGYNGSNDLDVLEVYDPATNTWTTGTAAPRTYPYSRGLVIDGTLYCAGRYWNSAFSEYQDIWDTYTRDSFELILGSGESLPLYPATVTLTASNIGDWVGNTITTSLDTTFQPFSGQASAINVYQPSGLRGGDITVNYLISDAEDNPVWLLAEYSTDDGTTWQAAAVTGDTTGIPSMSFEGSLVWNSGTDLPNQNVDRVKFRITCRDNNESWGGSDTVLIDIDNLAPEWIAAEGTSGSSTIEFWFNEAVSESTATDPANISVTGATYTVSDISTVEEWTTEAVTVPSYRYAVGIGELDGKLYAVGGYSDNEGDEVATVEVYDPALNTWSQVTDMPTKRQGPLVAGINGKLYVVGGHDSWISLNIVEVFDPENNSWTTKNPAPFTGFVPENINGRAINGRLYINHSYDGMYIYDPHTDTWENVPGGLGRIRVTTAAMNGKLYIAGGYYQSNDLVVFDPETRNTTTLASMPTDRENAYSGVIDGKLYVVGGYNYSAGSFLSIVEVYDPATDTWTTATSAPRPLGVGVGHAGPSGLALKGTLYLSVTLWHGTYGVNYTTFDTYSRGKYEITLGSGESLPSPPATITVTASNISDWLSNLATSLDTTFTPATGDAPTIKLYPPNGVQSGDVTIRRIVSDTENNPVWLLCEYTVPGDPTWYPATVQGDTSAITSDAYEADLVWNTAVDVPDQELYRAVLRVRVRDNDVEWGGVAVARLDVDNLAPTSVAAEGNAGEGTFRFWFNEPVNEPLATNTANYSLSHGLTINNITNVDGWSPIPEHSPWYRYYAGAAELHGKLYVVGGYHDVLNEYVNTLEVYDPTNDTWTDLTPMPTERDWPVVTSHNGWLYVLGGSNSSGDAYVIEFYHPGSDSWVSRSIPYSFGERHYWNGDFIKGKLYLNTDEGNIYVYDVRTDSWEIITGGLANYGASTVVYDDKLYIAGGWDSYIWGYSNELVVFDPSNNTTTSLQSMTTGRQDAVMEVLDGKIYVIGGYGDSGELGDVEIYDPVSNTWTAGTPSAVTSDEKTSAVINGQIYFGYQDWDGSSTFLNFNIYSRNNYEATLDAGQTLPFDRITLQATGMTDWYSNTATTTSGEFVPDDGNDNPTIVVYGITDEVNANVAISYSISDTEGDLVRLIPDYSIDEGNSWIRATTSPDTLNIAPSNYDGIITWYSVTDLPGLDLQDVRFRLTPCDNELELGEANDISLHLDNNELPSVTITNTTYSKTDTTWTFDYQLSDAESDTLDLTVEYSTDGALWTVATTPSSITGILSSGYTGSVVWQIERDLPGATLEASFRITPSDNDEGNPDQADVLLNTLGVPSVTIDSTYTAEQTGPITIPFTITDDEGDLVGLYAEYLDAGGTRQAASVTGDTSGLSSAEYSGTLVWNSVTDLAGADLPNAGFRLTPYDASTGFSDEVSFYLDNNAIPSVVVATPSGSQHRDVNLSFTLTDTEGDGLGILALYSSDGGTSWNNMTVSGDTTGITSANYSGQLTWRSFDDLGYGEFTNVTVKLIPHDLDAGTEGATSAFTVQNYIGDYTGDGSVSTGDFAVLLQAYRDQDTYHDIGPATGSVPLLMPTYDGVIDFEDLAVFIQMWNWSLGITAEQEAVEIQRPMVKPTAAQRQQGYQVELEEKLSDDPWADDNSILDLELKANRVSDVMVVGVELTYEPEHLRFLSLEPGTFLGRAGGNNPSLIYLQHVDEEKGRLVLMLGRLDAENPDVSGSGLLASLHFTKLSKENSDVTVAYELWDSNAEFMTSEQYQTEVHALRIPSEFALLQNYPNPFNSETIIRFQLPRAARVQMYVFNIRGQRVATLIDEQMDPGYHKVTWNGRNDHGRQVASGIYIYLIQAGRNRASQKLTIIK